MFKKIGDKLLNAGTIAMLGYEYGSHSDHTSENRPNTSTTIETNNSEVLMIAGIIIMIVILAAIAGKVLFSKRRLV